MKLKKLIGSVEIISTNVDHDIEINKIASDSRKILDNDVFVAIRGEAKNGNEYIFDALNKGAKAIVTDNEEIVDNIPYILVKDARSTLAKMWSNFYDNPTKNMKVIAVTGTNGKSSTSELIYSILKSANKKCAMISTIRCLIEDEEKMLGGGSEVSDKYAAMTTPDPEILYYILNNMKEKNVEYVVLETSSHALKQKKLDGIGVDYGVFTNLSHEHLDYHKSIDDYFSSKELLFEKSNFCIVNTDDEYGKKIYDKYKYKSASVANQEGNDFYATQVNFDKKGCKFLFNYQGGSLYINSPLCGKFVLYNALMASSVAKIIGVSNEAIVNGIFNVKRIKGRLERYKDKSIYIDYAHTPLATQQVLESIRAIENNKRIIVLFGCGGDRDKEKRKEIGKICSRLADVLIITSDNSRSEEPLLIIKDILAGVDKGKKHLIIPSRRQAITYGVKMLNEDSVLVLLGKGHENYEIDKNGKHFFDERQILDEAFKI